MTSAVSDPDPANNGATDSTDVVEAATPPLEGGLPSTSTARPPGERHGLDFTLAGFFVAMVFLVSAPLIGRAMPDRGIDHQATVPPLGQSADPATMSQ